MKYLLFAFCFPFDLFTGCIHDKTAADAPIKNVSVEVGITARPADRITRATDETQIKDLNVYLFGKSNTIQTSHLCAVAALAIRMSPSENTTFTLPNLHADGRLIPGRTRSLFRKLPRPAYDDLPRCRRRQPLTIAASAQGGGGYAPTGEVRRCVAKIAYNISSPMLRGHQTSIRAADGIPRTSLPVHLTPGPPKTRPIIFRILLVRPPGAPAFFGRMLYLPRIGGAAFRALLRKPTKSARNAPKTASYLLVRAVSGGKSTVIFYLFLRK